MKRSSLIEKFSFLDFSTMIEMANYQNKKLMRCSKLRLPIFEYSVKVLVLNLMISGYEPKRLFYFTTVKRILLDSMNSSTGQRRIWIYLWWIKQKTKLILRKNETWFTMLFKMLTRILETHFMSFHNDGGNNGLPTSKIKIFEVDIHKEDSLKANFNGDNSSI